MRLVWRVMNVEVNNVRTSGGGIKRCVNMWVDYGGGVGSANIFLCVFLSLYRAY